MSSWICCVERLRESKRNKTDTTAIPQEDFDKLVSFYLLREKYKITIYYWN